MSLSNAHEIPTTLKRLRDAADAWAVGAKPEGIERWMKREIDPDGVLKALSLPDWEAALAILMESRELRAGWPDLIDEQLLAIVRTLLRLCRTDGTLATLLDQAEPRSGSRLPLLLKKVAAIFSEKPEARVINWWLRPKARDESRVAPPSPAWSSPHQAIAALRSSWLAPTDALMIDHRIAGPTTCFELIGEGISWLGPRWRLMNENESEAARLTAPKPRTALNTSTGDYVEWAYRSDGVAHSRSATLLRDRKLAILAEQIDGPAIAEFAWETRITTAPGVEIEPIPESRGFGLKMPRSRKNAQVIPLALPALDYETDRGAFRFHQEDGELALRLAVKAKRAWMPIVISWDPMRHRKILSWRTLTISEAGKICPPGVAFAARLSWGRSETFLIYRSLGRPAARAFLGYQTDARFLIASFDENGDVEPILRLD